MPSENNTQARPQLAELLESIGAGQSAEREILKFLIARASEKDPALGETIRCCAIPRHFSAEIIGVLRQAPDDRETNEGHLSKLISFSFVRARPDGQYKYDDATREFLLEDWRSPDTREKFDRLNQQLVGFYKGQYERAVGLEPDLKCAGPILQQVNSARHVQVTSIYQTRLVAPLLEALYHKSLQSAEACYKYFAELYEEQETKNRLIVCESLLSGTRDCLERLPSDSNKEPWLKWLRYWKARLKREIHHDADAADILQKLLPETDDDTVLKLWVLGDLGATYYQQSRFHDAGQAYNQVIELAKNSQEDAYNLPVWYTRLAQWHWALEELAEAEEYYRKAIDCARDTNVRIEISATFSLSDVLYARGGWEDALNTALESLHNARTRLPAERQVYQEGLGQLMNLLARRDSRLLDTVFHEAKALIDATDRLGLLRFRRQYVDLLRQSGQLVRAEEQLQSLLEDSAKLEDQFLNLDMQFVAAQLLEEQGRREEAIAKYDQLAVAAQKHESGAWYFAAALSNSGINRAKLGHWAKAEADLQAGIKKWQEMSIAKVEASVHSALATAQRNQGKLAEAQQSVDQAYRVLGGTQSSYLNDTFEEQAKIYWTEGRNEEARKQYVQALERYRRLDQLKQAARTLTNLSELAAELGDWNEAARCTGEAAVLWQELAATNGYVPTQAAEKASSLNANGAEAFFVTGEERAKRISEARDLFLLACDEAPENFWYRLNLAYACADLEEWSEASAAVWQALNDAPEWLRSRMLYARLADYRAKEAEKVFQAGDYAKSVQLYSESRKQLETHVGFERLAEIELRLADSHLRSQQEREARTEYEKGLARVEKVSPDEKEAMQLQAVFQARLGLLEALQSASLKALEYFRTSVSLRNEAKLEGLVNDVVTVTKEFCDLVRSTGQYRALGEGLRALADDPSLKIDERQSLIGAQFDLSESQYRITRSPAAEAGRPTSSSDIPVASPIVVELDSRLVPLNENTPEIIRMIEVDIPVMRQELIFKNTGVTLPGIRIRPNEGFSDGLYQLILDEVPIISGQVFRGEKFCADSARCTELKLEGHQVANPADGTLGVWLPESSWKQAEEVGLQLRDPFQFIILHLGSLLRSNLDNFLGVQDVDNMLWQWNSENEADKRALVQAAVPDDGSRERLAQVLQHLVKEDVPVRNLLAILTTFAEANATIPELIELTERVRMALRSDLPINELDRKLIGLSPQFESAIAAWIQEQDTKRFLAMPAAEVQKLMKALGNHIGDRLPNSLGIIVATPGLRPYVSRFVRANYPAILVSAEKELTDGTKLPDERIEFNEG